MSGVCKLYSQCSDECKSNEICSLGKCIEQKFDFSSQYFVAAVIYVSFAIVTVVQTRRMLEETEFGCLKSCVRQRKGTKKQQKEQKKRPPVLIFLALSLLTRAVWFLLLDYWTELKQFDCRKTYEIETQYPTLIGLNISVCLFQFTTLSLIAMYLARVTYDSELRITLSASSSQHDSSTSYLGLQIYDYIYENDESVWLWAHCRCIHRAEFWIISNLWTYLIGLFFWIYEWNLICLESDEKSSEDTLKFLYILQVAAIAFLFVRTFSFEHFFKKSFDCVR